jgi:hypothetical protein
VRIYQHLDTHPEYVEQIRNLLGSLNATYSETYKNAICFELSGVVRDQIVDILSNDKKLAFDFILSLTKDQTHLFVNEVLKGDGYYEFRKNGSVINLMQKKARGLDAFKMACILLGYPINSQKCPDGFENVLSSNVKFHTPLNCYEKEDVYTGTLWCIEVENHTFYTRCGDSYYWTGNSVDSTSWVQFGKYGIVIVPYKKGGVYDYTQSPNTVFVSSRPKSKSNRDHFDNVVGMHQSYFTSYFEERGFVLGKSEFRTEAEGYKLQVGEQWADRKTNLVETIIESGLSNNHELRDQLNLQFYLDLEEKTPAYPRAWKPKAKITQLL